MTSPQQGGPEEGRTSVEAADPALSSFRPVAQEAETHHAETTRAAEVEASGADLTLPRAVPHSRLEDAYALLMAAGMIVVGLLFLKTAGLVTGGIAGFALFLTYVTGLSFGLLFLLLNLPFLFFAFFAMGREFATKTLLLSLAIPVLAQLAPFGLRLDYIHPGVAAAMGGTLVGFGLLAAARHHASVGGVGIVALWLQKREIVKAGYVQLAFDIGILALSVFRLSLVGVFWSAISMVTMSAILILWHRPGRYIGY